MKCPECKTTMKWQEGLLSDSGRNMSVGRHYCMDCRIFKKPVESRAIRKGRRLAKDLKGVHCMDKRITQYSATVQIGILRELALDRFCNKLEKQCLLI